MSILGVRTDGEYAPGAVGTDADAKVETDLMGILNAEDAEGYENINVFTGLKQ